MAQQLIRLPQVMAKTGLKKTAIYERVKDGNFPRPVSMGARAVAWVETEIDEWIARRIASRGQHVVVDAERLEAFNRQQAARQRKAA